MTTGLFKRPSCYQMPQQTTITYNTDHPCVEPIMNSCRLLRSHEVDAVMQNMIDDDNEIRIWVESILVMDAAEARDETILLADHLCRIKLGFGIYEHKFMVVEDISATLGIPVPLVRRLISKPTVRKYKARTKRVQSDRARDFKGRTYVGSEVLERGSKWASNIDDVIVVMNDRVKNN